MRKLKRTPYPREKNPGSNSSKPDSAKSESSSGAGFTTCKLERKKSEPAPEALVEKKPAPSNKACCIVSSEN